MAMQQAKKDTKQAAETTMLTLADAHREATRTRPTPDAPLVDWRTFHRVNADRYRAVSETDRFHHHEALYWVAHEEKRHTEVKHKIAASLATVGHANGDDTAGK